MIVSIEGILREAGLVRVVVETGGLGYEIGIPLTTAEKLPAIGSPVKLHTLAVYREDSQALYGFHSREERDFFRMLTERVSGIGPKIGLSIMSRLSLPVLKQAIGRGDVTLLAKCQGIGKKTAERLVVELRDKVLPTGSVAADSLATDGQAVEFSGTDTVIRDAVAALTSLGYKPQDADKSVRKALAGRNSGEVTTEALIKAALGS